MLTADITREHTLPIVRFISREIEDRSATIENGIAATKTIHHVQVISPGGKEYAEFTYLDWLDGKKKQIQEGRAPSEWLGLIEKGYEAWKNGQEIPLDGIPIRTWLSVNKEQRDRIIAANLLTVEQLSSANDQGLNSIGPGAVALKQKAEYYLITVKNTGKTTELLADQHAKISALETQLLTLTEQLKSLAAKPKP